MLTILELVKGRVTENVDKDWILRTHQLSHQTGCRSRIIWLAILVKLSTDNQPTKPSWEKLDWIQTDIYKSQVIQIENQLKFNVMDKI